MAAALGIDLLLIAAVGSLGFFICRELLEEEPLLVQLAVSFPLGAGLWALVVFSLGWLGLDVTGVTYLAAAAVVVVAGLTLRKLRQRERRGGGGQGASWIPGGREQLAVLAVAMVTFVALGWLAVARSYSTWDAMAIWSVKGYGIVREGSILAAAEWGSHGLSYPLQLPLLIGAFRLLTGDALPGSKLMFPLYYLSLLVGVYAFVRRRGLTWPWAGAAALAVGSVPLVFEHATIGYANLPLTALLLLGTVTFLGASGGSGPLLTSGILLGLAAWMRPEALYLVAAGMAGFALVTRLGSEKSIAWSAWTAPALVIGGGWLAFNLSHGVTGVFGDSVRTAAASLMSLDFNPGGAYRVLRFLAGRYASPEVWGLAAPLTALLALISWRRLAPDADPQAFSLLVAAVAWGLPVVVFYYLLSFRGDLAYWLGTGIDRLMMPATVAALLWGLTVAPPVGDERRTPMGSPSPPES